MTQETPSAEAETTVIKITPTDLLETLQSENAQLKDRLEELAQAGRQQDELTGRLAQAEAQSGELRRRYADAALARAVDAAAIELGIAPGAAAIFRSRFTCEIDAAGEAQITPDPAGVLAAELAGNPMLRQSVDRGRADRNTAAVANGAAEVAEVDPVELMTALDRSASRKAQFIARHGTQAFIDLAQAADRKGYRR